MITDLKYANGQCIFLIAAYHC